MKGIFFLTILLGVFSINTNAQDIEWACRVVESNNQRSGENSTQSIIGVPNVYPNSKIGNSWIVGFNGKEEVKEEISIKLHFCKPIYAKQVLIIENFNPGAVKAVYVYDARLNEKLIYTSTPKSHPESSRILSIDIDTLQAPVNYIKIIAQPSIVQGFNCIDAVGITSSIKPVSLNVNLDPSPGFIPSSFQYLNGNINTIYDEYSPIISPDGKTLYFARMGDPENKGGKNGDIDIWYSNMDETGKWSPAKNMGSPLNNLNHNFVASVVDNGEGLLLGTTYGPNGKSLGEGCSVSKRIKSRWGLPRNLDMKHLYNKNDHVSFFMSDNQKVLLMSIEDKGHSFGEQDIYVSFLNYDDTWSSPINLGPDVNTVKSEKNIFLAKDMKTLYFSSDGYLGYGGHDIYKTTRLDSTWKKWSKPMNIGRSINTPDDELSFAVTADGKFGFGYKYAGNDQKHDIFVVGQNDNSKLTRSDSVIALSGVISELNTGKKLAAKLTIHNMNNGNEAGEITSDSATGKYIIFLPKESAYSININSPGHMPVSENVFINLKNGYQEEIKDIVLKPIEIGNSFNLKNVFFRKGTASLVETSYLELNHIFQFLKNNPTVSIRLEGHTDNQGDPLKNVELSEERVRTVRNYLVEYGINPKRIVYKALGGSMPVASNDDEETRKLNRRVEFVIIKK